MNTSVRNNGLPFIFIEEDYYTQLQGTGGIERILSKDKELSSLDRERVLLLNHALLSHLGCLEDVTSIFTLNDTYTKYTTFLGDMQELINKVSKIPDTYSNVYNFIKERYGDNAFPPHTIVDAVFNLKQTSIPLEACVPSIRYLYDSGIVVVLLDKGFFDIRTVSVKHPYTVSIAMGVLNCMKDNGCTLTDVLRSPLAKITF